MASVRQFRPIGTVIISALLVVNVLMRSWQENKASNEIELLKKRLALAAKVLRDGKWADLPAKELVPGDIVRLRLGNIVPADTKLVDGAYLQMTSRFRRSRHE